MKLTTRVLYDFCYLPALPIVLIVLVVVDIYSTHTHTHGPTLHIITPTLILDSHTCIQPAQSPAFRLPQEGKALVAAADSPIHPACIGGKTVEIAGNRVSTVLYSTSRAQSTLPACCSQLFLFCLPDRQTAVAKDKKSTKSVCVKQRNPSRND